jgi:hypothetical protein
LDLQKRKEARPQKDKRRMQKRGNFCILKLFYGLVVA